MTIDPTPPQCAAIAPVTDYEPPAYAAPRTANPHARHASTPRSHPAPRRCPPPRVRETSPTQLHSVALFADAALRRVLEVVDQRRPPAHLRPLLAAGLTESLLALRPVSVTGPPRPATLQRVGIQPVGGRAPVTAVEVFGTYRRGERTHALACRIESMPEMARRGTATPWQIVALHLG